jgi:glutathione synthase/RimK-type ligase-like ATP-grasp enzyme
MENQILIIVDYLNFLRNDLYRTSTLNLDSIRSLLSREGYQVEIKTFQQILRAEKKPRGKIIWYASSDFPSYKAYIEDILLGLHEDNLLIPSFDLFRAHDNKGYQTILRRKLELPFLKEYYFGTFEEVMENIDALRYPIVLKKPGGSGSTNVRLILSRRHLIRTVKGFARKGRFTVNLLKKYLKRYIFTKKYTYDHSRESLYYENIILQEFIPGLSNDWKVLIFGDKYFVFERKVRTHDFRASGSGKFFYREFDTAMLDFCASIYDKLRTPWASLDVCFDGHNYHLIEFQGINFGPIGLLNAPYYFTKQDFQKWNKIYEKCDLSTEYATALIGHINKNK